MKYYLILVAMCLAACTQSNPETAQPASAASQVAAQTASQTASAVSPIESLSRSAQNVSGSVRDRYLEMCVSSALQNQVRDEQKVKIAASICECAYDEGVKAYDNNATAFDAAVKNSFDHPDKIDEKLLKVSDDTISACMKKFAPQPATASETKK